MGKTQELKDSEFEAALITLSINTKIVYKNSHINPSLLSFTSLTKTMVYRADWSLWTYLPKIYIQHAFHILHTVSGYSKQDSLQSISRNSRKYVLGFQIQGDKYGEILFSFIFAESQWQEATSGCPEIHLTTEAVRM